MAMELKNILMQLRMVIRFSYRTARAHLYISSMLFFLLLLYRIFPSLFSFLVSSSPVIICTGMLLGTLLSYGSPNIPQVEEEDEIMINQKISSLQVEKSDTDDIVVQKEESTNAAVDITKDFAFRKGLNENDDIIAMEENNDGKYEVEGLTLNITNDGPFDSSLGSPWQPVDTSKAYSNYDSESDGSESSSDDSMTDILPMLDELHPLLDSENSQPVLTSVKSSDLSSNEISHDNESSHDQESSHDHESSRDLESEEDNVTKEGELKNSKTKEDTSNEVAVAWNENDQNNVMDLGYSEIERNRRLENLIARRRLRKLQSQKYENEKNLIDLESFYPTSIPSISAPRRNPFDLPQDYDSNLNLPPIPGSAPSVMQPRHNPFDLPYDLAEESGSMSREYLKHHDFISDAQKDMLSRRVDNFTSRPSFLGITTFERQLSGESDFKISFASGSDVDSPFKGHHDEVNESELRKERPALSPINNDEEEEGRNIDQLADLNVSSDVTVGEGGVEREGNEIIEERSVESDSSSSSSSSSESIENISELNARDEFINMDDTVQLNKSLDLAQNHAVTIEDSSEVTPPQKIFEGSTYVEINDLGSSGTGHILVQSSVPSVLDESGSREMEISEIKEHNLDVDQNMQSEDTDLNPLASFVQADIPDVASPQNLLETSVPVVDQNSAKPESMGENLQENVQRVGNISGAKGHSIDMDNIQSDTNYTIEEPSSPASESESSTSSESSGEESRSHNADINLADNQKTITNESIFSASVDSQVEEPDVFISDIEHDKPSGSEIKFENDIISEHNEEPLKGSFNPDTEQENEISNINDEFLEELDVVGDFNIGRELKPNQEATSNQEQEHFDIRKIDIHLANDPEMTVYNPNLRVLDAYSIEELHSVFKQDNEAAVLPGIENSKSTISETVDSGSGASVTDTDMIVLEAKSVEDINIALRQQIQSETEQNILNVEEETNIDIKDTYPEHTIETDMIVLEAKSIDDINSALEHHIVAEEPNKLKVEENNNVDAADMIVLEAKSVEDINTALRRQTEGGVEQSELNVEEKTNIDASDTHPDNTDTNMIVLEAKSIDDIDSAIVHHLVAEEPDSLKVEETNNVDAAATIVLEAKSVEDINTALKRQTEGGTEQSTLNVDEKTNAGTRDAYLSNTDTNMIVLEAKSIDDINSALEQHIVAEEPNNLKAEENNNVDTADMIVLEAKSIEDINTAFRKQTKGGTQETVLNDEEKTNAEVGDTYPDNTDTNMIVLEAKSIDDINSALEHHLVAVESTNLELEENNNVEAVDMIVLEEKSVEDITTAFNKQPECSAEQNILEVEESTDLEIRDKDTDNTDTDMSVSETKSIEDIGAALKEHAEDAKEHNVLGESDSELHTVEAKSIDDINLVINQLNPHVEAGSSGRQEDELDHIENAEKSDDKFDRVLVADDISST